MNAMNEAYREFFKGAFPDHVTVQSGLMSPDALVEIMCTAVK
jgi:enamine deaminase RidA (YjgF/YER057c/UK114 family)